ncbi:MAG: hypothetical protein ACTJG4_16215, partial [Vreelandella alkaliphila]|uniref:hypothetical protein n=1 Tax=Vreelandella alkaliphila TaxID=272774 RepID=UPI003F955CBA
SRPRHSRRPLAGIHVDLGFRAAAGQGQDGFPITPLGNGGVVTRENSRHTPSKAIQMMYKQQENTHAWSI